MYKYRLIYTTNVHVQTDLQLQMYKYRLIYNYKCTD